MKTMIKLLAFLMLASVPMFFAGAKPNSAPGIQKKSLEILNVTIVEIGTEVEISWETNFRAQGAVAIDDYVIADEAIGTRHSVTIPYIIERLTYTFSIVSFSELYRSAVPYEGSFTF